MRHTGDRHPFDKVTDSTDEVVLRARSCLHMVLLDSKESEDKKKSAEVEKSLVANV